ncbi:MAG TPA: hypothetical protein P5117_05275 [Spirochaetia bacterium]|nr:hypothetical protein [Spirochaetales bacterium]HRY78843.1 hypothetical protein [Spirochaetia bacterium]HRZ88878.1 hypothetical protein [Spirochaetia bacterium]
MKKYALLTLALGVLLTGCATVWKTLGVATVQSVEENNAQIARRIDELAVRAASGDAALAKAVELEKLVKELQGRMDGLPADTLARLADLLAKAAEEARKAAGK